MPHQSSGIWQVHEAQASKPWCDYRFVAVANEQGSDFRLQCERLQPFYILNVYQDDVSIFDRLLNPAPDADLDKFVWQVMRIANHDIARKLARVDRLHTDAFLGVTRYFKCRPAKRES